MFVVASHLGSCGWR